jgi:cytochrome c peroxidase
MFRDVRVLLRAAMLSAALMATAASVLAQDNSGKVAVGSKLFKDPRLSASGQMACASCHVEAHGHADLPGTGLPKGGPNLDLSGMRSSPTARYLNQNPAFSLAEHGDARGGFTWDGRADSRREQARAPFFSPVEMALPGSPEQPGALTALVRSAVYYPELQALYAPEQIDTDLKLFKRITELLAIYQHGDPDYNRFDSRFDQAQAGTATLSDSEQRGFALFTNPQQGNCASCHSAAGKKPLFTHFGFSNLGVPRNHAGPKNANPDYFDLGLCAREKSPDPQVQGKARYCGQFKTPTLRNVSRTAPYFHNGAIATLEEAVLFHFLRDAEPARWYRTADGNPDRRYNDLPQAYQGNVVQGRPFNGAFQPTAAQLADLLAFLRTLDDADQTAPLR